MATTNKLPAGSTWEQFILENVTSNQTVTITFAADTDGSGIPDKYETITVTAVAGDGGSVSPEKKIITRGEDVTLSITPNSGFAVDTIVTEDTTYVNNPNYGTVIADSAEAIEEAATNPDITTLAINAPISTTANVQFDKPMTIEGNGNTVTQETTGKTFTMTQDSTVSNIEIESTADNTDWHSSYALQFYTGEHTVSNVKLSGGNAGIIVNSSTVSLEGTIDVSNNTFGGIEVSKGSAEGLTAGVLNINGATLVNTTEAYGKPTIWIDGNTDEEGIVNGAEALTMVEVPHGETTQKQFYLNAENSNKFSVNGVAYATIEEAIAAADGATIKVNADMDAGFTMAAGTHADIDGNGHTLHGMIALSSGTAGEQGSLKVANMVFDGGTTSAWAIRSQNQTETAGESTFTVEMVDCTVQNYIKKGLYATELSAITLTNCTFDTCATEDMNDPNTWGDYVVDLNLMGVHDVDVNITGCTFKNNGAQKASVKVTARGGESDEDATDVPHGISTSVATFNVSGCTFQDTACEADVYIGSDNKSASTNPDAENTTGNFGMTTITDIVEETKVKTQYDGQMYTLNVEQTFTKAQNQEPVIS